MSVFTGYWAERAGQAEDFEARAYDALLRLRERYSMSWAYEDLSAVDDLLARHRQLNAHRARALPAGATKIGNLTSGGIDV